jgi:Pyruvate/2-oxoacid:ferredoxin oxidoreductase delta subunit
LEGGNEFLKRRIDPPKVEESKCISCGLCVTVCPSFVLEMRNKKAEVVRGAWCIGCDHCGAVCPTEAILHNGSSISSRNDSYHLSRNDEALFSGETVPSSLQERTCVGGIVEADS